MDQNFPTSGLTDQFNVESNDNPMQQFQNENPAVQVQMSNQDSAIYRSYELKLKEYNIHQKSWTLYDQNEIHYQYYRPEIEILKLFCQVNQIELVIEEIEDNKLLDSGLPLLKVNSTVYFQQQDIVPFLGEISGYNKILDQQFRTHLEELYLSVKYFMFICEETNYAYRDVFNVLRNPIKKAQNLKFLYDLKCELKNKGIFSKESALQNAKLSLNQLDIIKLQQGNFDFNEERKSKKNANFEKIYLNDIAFYCYFKCLFANIADSDLFYMVDVFQGVYSYYTQMSHYIIKTEKYTQDLANDEMVPQQYRKKGEKKCLVKEDKDQYNRSKKEIYISLGVFCALTAQYFLKKQF